MHVDKFSQQIFTEKDLCDLYMIDPNRKLKSVLTEEKIQFNPTLNVETVPELIQYQISDQSITQFDHAKSSNWFMPDEYKTLDIAHWVLSQCKNDEELQRAGEELLLYQERDMFVLLRYLKYLVDTMRSNNILWGVGRGSSVASFVLYIIGIHRINSLYYQLPINEFLR